MGTVYKKQFSGMAAPPKSNNYPSTVLYRKHTATKETQYSSYVITDSTPKSNMSVVCCQGNLANDAELEDIQAAKSYITTGDSYTFDSDNGFTVTNPVYSDTIQNILGKYYVDDGKTQLLYQIQSTLDWYFVSYGSIYLITSTMLAVAEAGVTTITYPEPFSYGGVEYVYADEGCYPEEGTLVDGSLDGDYLVLQIDNAYYRYTKQV